MEKRTVKAKSTLLYEFNVQIQFGAKNIKEAREFISKLIEKEGEEK